MGLSAKTALVAGAPRGIGRDAVSFLASGGMDFVTGCSLDANGASCLRS